MCPSWLSKSEQCALGRVLSRLSRAYQPSAGEGLWAHSRVTPGFPSTVGGRVVLLSARRLPAWEEKVSLAEQDPLTSLRNLLWVPWTKAKRFIFVFWHCEWILWGLGPGLSLPPEYPDRTTALCCSASSLLPSPFSPPRRQSWKRSQGIHSRYLY